MLAQGSLAMKTQEMINGLHANAQRACGLVFVEVLEGEEGRARTLENPLDDVVDGRVVAALEAGELNGGEVGMACGKLGGPDLVIGGGGVAVLPHV